MPRIDLMAGRVEKSQLQTISAVGVGGDNRRVAWLKEMQRAQSEAWFRHPLLIRPEFFGVSHTRIEMQEDKKSVAVNASQYVSDGGIEQPSPLAHSSTQNAEKVDVVNVNQETEGSNNASSESMLPMQHSRESFSEGATQGKEQGDVVTSLAVFSNNSATVVSSVGALYGHAGPESLPSLSEHNAPPVVQPANTTELLIGVLSQPGIDVQPLRDDVGEIVVNTVERSARSGQIPMKDNTPVRVSAHWSGDDVSVWLGVNSSHWQEISTIVRKVRALVSEHGANVRSIVCNGKYWDVTTNTATEGNGLDDTEGGVVVAQLKVFNHNGDRHGN